MMPVLQSSPDSVWYTFNMVSGRYLTNGGHQWNAQNPNYDPGPLPPPKPPRQRKATGSGSHNGDQIAKETETTTWKPRRMGKDGQTHNSYQRSDQQRGPPRGPPRKHTIQGTASRIGSSAPHPSQSARGGGQRYHPRRENHPHNHRSLALPDRPQQAARGATIPATSTELSRPSISTSGENTTVPNTQIRTAAAS